MGIDNGCHVVLLSYTVQQGIYHQRCLWVKAGIRLVAKQILRIECYGSRYGHTFLHTSGYLSWIFALRLYQIHTVKARLRPLYTVTQVHGREHIEGKHDVFEHGKRVEQCGTLEDHTHLAAQHNLLALAHGHEVAPVVEHTAARRSEKSHEIFHQHGLSRTALAYYQVGFAVFKHCTDILQHLSAGKRFAQMRYLNHNKWGSWECD